MRMYRRISGAETTAKTTAWDGASGGRPWAGRIEACTIYGSAITWQDIQAHWQATGLAQ